MLVAIDAGNTDVKLALMRDGQTVSSRRWPSGPSVAAYDAEGLLVDALGTTDLGGPTPDLEALVMVSVVPAWTAAFEDLARRMDRPLIQATAGSIPIAVRGPDRHRVGADRLLDAFAAAHLYPAPVIVVDLGTATTIDAIAGDGAFVGGAICAGVGLGVAALASGTALLPRPGLDVIPASAIGTDTESAMQAGAIIGHVGIVRELVESMANELAREGEPVKVVVTGGYAAAPWAHLLRAVDVIDPELTFRGLYLLHAHVLGARSAESVV